MNRTWILAMHVALGTACRAGAPARSTTPASQTPSPAAPARPSESAAVAHGGPTPSADATPTASREDTSPAGIARYYLREGAFPTREETYRPGLTFEGALEGEIERDGSHAQLVVLGTPLDRPRDTDRMPDRVLVYLRRTAAGWRSELLDAGFETYWQRPLVLAGRSTLVVALHNLTHSEWDSPEGVPMFHPGGVTYFYSLASRGADGRWSWFEPALETFEYYERYEFAGLPDGSLLVTSLGGRRRTRWRVLRVDWTERRIIVPDGWGDDSGWSRGAPPASSPRPPVAWMEGVTCPARLDAPFRLRDTGTAAPTGAQHPAHTQVAIVAATGIVRGDARLYRVRVVNATGAPGPEGFAFVRGREIGDTCPLP